MVVALLIALVGPPIVPMLELSQAAAGGRLSLISQGGHEIEYGFARAGGWQANFESQPATIAIEPTNWRVAMIGCDFASMSSTSEQRKIVGDVDSIKCSALALVRREGHLGGSPVAVSESGLRCEIQPVLDPTTPAGGITAVKLRHEGKSQPSVVLHVEIDGFERTVKTNASGVAEIPHEVGRYRLWSLWREANGKRGLAASLTYEVRP